MGAAPAWADTGTVTFLLSDVQGSTKLWETEAEAMAVALPRHDAIFAELIDSHAGWLVKSKGEGDSVFAVFAGPAEAIAAAIEIQRALLREQWPTSRPLAVRMSIHSGDAELRDGDWYGPTVNRAARIRATAHGGQVVVSETARLGVGDTLPPGCTLRDLGERRLKDLTEPERIWQLQHPDLPASFPPLAALDARPHNLPVQPTPFIGRAGDVAAVRDKLREDGVRLVTLTGTGGVGKTRLALQVAAECIDDFDHGVWLVALAPVGDDEMVAPAIAAALGVEDDGRPAIEAVSDHVRDKSLLLVLDNFEHLLDAATVVADLLAAAPGLKVLATSREWLHLRAEHEIPLGPLPLEPALELFVDRAAAVAPGFHPAGADLEQVAAICSILDGLPLAIELVAARVRRFDLAVLLEQLTRPLDAATDGARDLPARQRTLRDTIAWSYALLDEAEREVFRRLAVFAGGARLDALAAVCDGGEEVPALTESLVDKSLARFEVGAGDERRVVVLEAVRQFALEQLEASGALPDAARAHARWHAELAATGDEQLTGPHQAEWAARLEEEHANLRAALGWLRAEPEEAQRLGGHLSRFWSMRGHLSEGRRMYAELLALPGEDPEPRAACLLGAGNLAEAQRDEAEADRLLHKGLATYAAIGHGRGMAQCHNRLGDLARRRGQLDAAAEHYDTSIELFASAGAEREVALMLTKTGIVCHGEGDTVRAKELWLDALNRAEGLGDSATAASVGNNLGLLALEEGEHEAAARHFERSVSMHRETGARRLLMTSLHNTAVAREKLGDTGGAALCFSEAADLAREVGDAGVQKQAMYGLARVELRRNVARGRAVVEELSNIAESAADVTGCVNAWGLLTAAGLAGDDLGLASEGVRSALTVAMRLGASEHVAVQHCNMAELATLQDDHQRAARLFGAADATAAGTAERIAAGALGRTRTTLGDGLFEEAHAEGGRWSVDEAVRFALG